jgi:hypothetical protein
MSKETGGSAFPVHPDVNTVKDTEWLGMSLRDYFAASFLANKWCAGTSPEATARAAYQAADAMLKAREQ